jgi:hypothetical protein
VCVAGAYHKREICSAQKHHKAKEVETRLWEVVTRVFKYPERLRASLHHMIEQERLGTCGDPANETERWLEEISEVGCKRARYREMAAERLIDFKE